MMTSPDQRLPAASTPGQILASHADRDATAQRLQDAFAEHRLDDEEFDSRIRLALTARTTGDLANLTADLPAQRVATTTPAGRSARRGSLAVAMKSSITRSGRWSVPRRFSCLVYKGSGLIDLRDAELTAAVTTIRAISYKSRTQILLPPGVRLELGGFGVSARAAAAAAGSAEVPDEPGHPGGSRLALPEPAADGPVVHVRGLAYGGSIEAITRQ
jgi:Domain of unknown function (DUF1707)